jgi:mannose-6-phosphate isomerase-like protein (cupin superfamily)
MNSLRMVLIGMGFLALAWSAGCVVDHVKPEPPAPESYYPAAGQVIHSRAEGFTSRVIQTDRERTWLELRLAPHASGPPPHLHTGFAEHFYVERGSLSLRVGNKVMVLHAGEEFRVPPGVVHQPFNPTDEEVIVRGPLTVEYALPRSFVLFLSQIYGFIDESPAHAKPPAVVLQMALFGPRYDAWMATPPLAVQRIQTKLLRPIARLLGYHSYYERFAPTPKSSPESAAAAAIDEPWRARQ